MALQPETGKAVWTWESNRGMPPLRGISTWPGDAHHSPHLMFATGSGYLVALNVKTGTLVPGFGNEGAMDLKVSVARPSLAPSTYQSTHLMSTGRGPGPGDARNRAGTVYHSECTEEK